MALEPLVTIAIPTYNRADTYFPHALQSALRQTYSNLEIMVSDNCSTDRTRELVTSIDDRRLRYVRHESNIGQKNNYKFCFYHAKGRYCLLLHDDDMIDSDFVSSCIEAAEGAPDIGLIRTGVRLIDAEGRTIGQMTNEAAGLPTDAFFQAWFSGRTAVYCCSTLFSTDKLLKIGGFNSTHYIYPDTIAVFRLAAGYPRIDVPDAKASYRIHSGEVGCSRKIADWCEDSLELLDIMCDLAPQSRDEIRKAGTRFFARANYLRANTAGTPWKRAVATAKVLSSFHYRQFPSPGVVLQILHGTRLYRSLRFVKRSFRYAVSPV